MANENVPAHAPTRSDDQILPFNAWVPIGKSNYEAKTGVYLFQLDKDWFILNASLLREALDITPIDQAHQFESPPLGDATMDFLNALAIQRKSTLPRYPVLQMLWGIITRTNVDYAELMWEEFVQAIQTFLAYKVNLGIATKKDKKIKPYVIPYCRFTKLIICYLGRKHNINQRSGSLFNMAEDDHRLGNLKFVPKGEEDEVFGMQIPKDLITDNIRNVSYYNAYLEMVGKHDHKIVAEEGGKKKSSTKANQSKKHAIAKQPRQPSPVKKASKGKVRKVRKGKSSLQLIDEPNEEQAHPEPQGKEVSFQPPIGEVAFHEPSLGITHKLPTVEGKGKGISTNEHIPVTEEASTGPSAQPEDDTSANIVRDTPSPTDVETGAETDKTNSEGDTEILNIGEEQGEDVANKVDLEEKIAEIDEGQAGSDPGKTPESQPPPERVLMEEDQAGPNLGQSHVAFAGPDPEPMHDDFISNVYPQVHESLKHLDEEHSPKDEPRNANMETEVESMVIVPIHQASSSVPRLTTLVIDLTPPKLVSSTVQEPVFTATTKTTTTTLPLPPPPQQQSSKDPDLASHVSTLEQFYDLPHKINQTVNKVVKESVQIALQAPLYECFRDLSKAEMKEILHQRMFESGLYQSQPEHVALYEALKASMDRDNQEEFLKATTKSRKRSRDDQDPPPPPPDLN
ncbi:hypothetical protein Tco_0070910 [Tanacetum coccineum]